jgi:hypothetical protein
MKLCETCATEISEHAFHTGHERWCEDCFESGLVQDMNDHFANTVKEESSQDSNKNS